MEWVHVDGKDKGKVRLYALSTCVWCKKTKEFLSSIGVAYDFVFVDLHRGAERSQLVEEIKKYNPSCSFPTLVINDDKCIVGFREKEILEALK